MGDHNESGRYSLAGFVYQLVGTATEAFELLVEGKDLETLDQLLVIERFGQDSATLPKSGSSKKLRLTQYKFSSIDAIIEQSELRKILERLLVSVENEGKQTSEFDFELVTNRRLSDDAKKWETAKKSGRKELSKCIQSSSNSRLENLDALCDLYPRLVYKRRTRKQLVESLTEAAENLGVLAGEETEAGIEQILGHICQVVEAPGGRSVHPPAIRSKLAGHPNACELFSDESIKMRQKALDAFQSEEADLPIIQRTQLEEIVEALQRYPIVLLHGDGGNGKSVAMYSAVADCLREPNQPPGFGLIVRAMNCNAQHVMDEIAGWRGLGAHKDGQQFLTSFRRLEGAFKSKPTLLICIDAVDETDGQALPFDVQNFIRELIRIAEDSRNEIGVPALSILATCRRPHEFDRILSRGNRSLLREDRVKPINIGEYENEELEAAIIQSNGISVSASNRLNTYLEGSQITRGGRRPPRIPSTLPVAEEVIEILRHPVLFDIFANLSEDMQEVCLIGDDSGLAQLGVGFLQWFQSKAERRIKDLEQIECETALQAAVRALDSLDAIGDRKLDWISPVITATGTSEMKAMQLFKECLSAGLIIEMENGGKTWRWRHAWFGKYLLESEQMS